MYINWTCFVWRNNILQSGENPRGAAADAVPVERRIKQELVIGASGAPTIARRLYILLAIYDDGLEAAEEICRAQGLKHAATASVATVGSKEIEIVNSPKVDALIQCRPGL